MGMCLKRLGHYRSSGSATDIHSGGMISSALQWLEDWMTVTVTDPTWDSMPVLSLNWPAHHIENAPSGR